MFLLLWTIVLSPDVEIGTSNNCSPEVRIIRNSVSPWLPGNNNSSRLQANAVTRCSKPLRIDAPVVVNDKATCKTLWRKLGPDCVQFSTTTSTFTGKDHATDTW